MPQRSRVTHKEIARRVGCDKSTVSLALRNHPRISAEMRRRVQAMAEKLGYRPDPGLSMLARQRWSGHEVGSGSTLAYIVRRAHHVYEHMQAVFFPGAKERAEERGFQLIEFDLDDYRSAQAAGKVLYSRGIQGLILSYIPPNDSPSEFAFDWDKFTVVTLWHGWGHLPFHAVGKNIFESTRTVWHQVQARGYRRIGAALLTEEPVSLVDAARRGASLVAQEDLIPPQDRIPFLLSGFGDKAAYLSWYERYRPEVIIGRNEQTYEWLLEEGIRVPKDVAFACLNVHPDTGIAGASTMYREIGHALLDYLVSQMYENRWGVPAVRHKVELDPIWLDGPSLPVVSPARLATR